MTRQEQIRQAALAYSFDTDGGHSGDLNADEKRVEKIRWRAKYKCRYYLVTSCLKVGSNIDFRHTEDEERWEVGNYFRTGEQAEEAAKILRETLCKFHTEKAQ